MLSVVNLWKKYKEVQALRGISFEVEAGEIFGIIGPDGAGKTTLFRILTTLLLADEGSAVLNGLDVVDNFEEIRRRIGYMPGRFSLYQDLSVEENLNFYAKIFSTGIEENYSLIRDIYQHLKPFKKRRAGALSGGMKQKLALCCALIHRPLVLFLDEPTTGIDPVSRKELWQMLRKLKEQGITIIVSTPYMDEASLCDRIALIREGIFLKIDAPENIVNQFDGTLWSVAADNMSKLLQDLRQHEHILTVFTFGDTHHATVDASALSINDLANDLEKNGYHHIEIHEIKAGIEDCFMALERNK
ncbi:MAG: ABC transporter ATP-binding protein [Bacteroidales bacterium]|nr:ABC transporter ATP-binding protein [Bacteroidales bacterium]